MQAGSNGKIISRGILIKGFKVYAATSRRNKWNLLHEFGLRVRVHVETGLIQTAFKMKHHVR